MTCWLNGELTESALLDATSAGALLGWGVFTTVGIRNSQPLLFERHYARLHRDARAARIPFEWSEAAIYEGLTALIKTNEIEHGIARFTLLRRDDGRWNSDAGNDLILLAQPSQPTPSAGTRVFVSRYHVSREWPLIGVKTTSYLPYFLAWQEAREQGYDEALLQTERYGSVCEGARTSIFWVQEGQLMAPSLDSGCLAGVGREWVLDWAKEHEFPTHSVMFPLPRLLAADEAFLISAATGPRPIASIFNPASKTESQIPSPGPLTQALRAAWQRI